MTIIKATGADGKEHTYPWTAKKPWSGSCWSCVFLRYDGHDDYCDCELGNPFAEPGKCDAHAEEV